MTISDALTTLGVSENTLSGDEKATLDRDGYLVLHGMLTLDQVGMLNARLAAIFAAEGENAGKEVHQEPGTQRLSNLANKDALFEWLFTHPRLLAGVSHVLGGDLKLSSLNYRAALPGAGLQSLHCDWSGPVPVGEYQVCNAIWLLDDFSPENGATRVVPGSHRWEKTPQEALADPTAPHPDEAILTEPAGTVVIFNSHVWHGGTINRTDALRRGVHSYFSRRAQPQQTDQKASLSPERIALLSPAARTILDV